MSLDPIPLGTVLLDPELRAANLQDPKLQALAEIGRYLQRRNYHFITVTPQTHQYYLQRHQERLATQLRDVFGWCLPFESKLLDAELWRWMQQADCIEKHTLGWRSKVRWSSLGEALFVHSGYPTDEQDAVFFGPDTYRFTRAIDDFLRGNREDIRTVADIGCGSGAGAAYLTAYKTGIVGGTTMKLMWTFSVKNCSKTLIKTSNESRLWY